MADIKIVEGANVLEQAGNILGDSRFILKTKKSRLSDIHIVAVARVEILSMFLKK